jgi:hypothetical protein
MAASAHPTNIAPQPSHRREAADERDSSGSVGWAEGWRKQHTAALNRDGFRIKAVPVRLHPPALNCS